MPLLRPQKGAKSSPLIGLWNPGTTGQSISPNSPYPLFPAEFWWLLVIWWWPLWLPFPFSKTSPPVSLEFSNLEQEIEKFCVKNVWFGTRLDVFEFRNGSLNGHHQTTNNHQKLLRLKLKDYPHLMMELFEVATGNWFVVVAVVEFRIEKTHFPLPSIVIRAL